MVEPEGAQRLLERGTVEVAPLAFMRGRTLNDSFIILDEAQNTTPEQMKMFLTRIGFGSKVGRHRRRHPGRRAAAAAAGLVGLERILAGIDGLAFVHLTARDVVRHRIVQDIVDAYEQADGPARSSRRARRESATGDRSRERSRSAPSPPSAGAARRPMRATLEVFVADEQADRPVDAARWAALAEAGARAPRGSRGDAELSVLFVDEADDRRLNRAVHGRRRPDRRARLPARRRPGRAGPLAPTPAPVGPATARRPTDRRRRCCSATS